MIRLNTSLDLIRAPGNHRNTDTAFINIPLDTFQRPVALEIIGVSSTFPVRAVVAGKNNDRILIQSQFFQFSHYIDDIFIQSRYHSGKRGIRLFRWMISHLAVVRNFLKSIFIQLIDRVVRQIQLGMGQRISQHGIERFIFIVADKLQSLFMDQILRIDLTPFFIVFMQEDCIVIMPQMIGIITMCLTLAVVSEKLIEAHCRRDRGRPRIPQSPFTENTGGISRRFHQFTQGIGIGTHRLLSFRIDLFVSAYLGMSSMQSGHQRTA